LLVAINSPVFDCLRPADIIIMRSAHFRKSINVRFHVQQIAFSVLLPIFRSQAPASLFYQVFNVKVHPPSLLGCRQGGQEYKCLPCPVSFLIAGEQAGHPSPVTESQAQDLRQDEKCGGCISAPGLGNTSNRSKWHFL
jgi:hypothetical protein